MGDLLPICHRSLTMSEHSVLLQHLPSCTSTRSLSAVSVGHLPCVDENPPHQPRFSSESGIGAAYGMTEDNELVKDNITVNRAAEAMDSTLLEMIEIGTGTGDRGGPNRVAKRAKNTSNGLIYSKSPDHVHGGGGTPRVSETVGRR